MHSCKPSTGGPPSPLLGVEDWCCTFLHREQVPGMQLEMMERQAMDSARSVAPQHVVSKVVLACMAPPGRSHMQGFLLKDILLAPPGISGEKAAQLLPASAARFTAVWQPSRSCRTAAA